MRRLPNPRVEESGPEINITSLIDVVFVVLIGFILIAPLLEMDRIQLADAGSDAHEVDARTISPLQIAVRKDNTIYFNKKEVQLEELRELLAAEKLAHPDEKPKLIQDKQAYFGTYQDIKNLLASLGYDEMELILNPCNK